MGLMSLHEPSWASPLPPSPIFGNHWVMHCKLIILWYQSQHTWITVGKVVTMLDRWYKGRHFDSCLDNCNMFEFPYNFFVFYYHSLPLNIPHPFPILPPSVYETWEVNRKSIASPIYFLLVEHAPIIHISINWLASSLFKNTGWTAFSCTFLAYARGLRTPRFIVSCSKAVKYQAGLPLSLFSWNCFIFFNFFSFSLNLLK